MRLDAEHRAPPSRRSAAGGSRCRSRRRARRGRPSDATARIAGSISAVAVDRAVLELVRRGVVPDVRARDGARRAAGSTPGPDVRRRTSPFGVWNCAAMMPGVPWGATHSTLTSSSGASTVSPSHSLTRCGSPAISRQASDTVAGRRRRSGAARSGLSHWMKNGSCGSAIRPLTPICFQSSSVPSGRCRLPVHGLATEPVLERRDVVDRDDPAEPAAAERGAGAHGLAERRLVGGRVVEHLDDLEVGVVGQRQDHVAGPEPRVDATVDEVLAEQPPDALGGAGEAVRVRRRSERWSRRMRSILRHAARAIRTRGSGLLTSRRSDRRARSATAQRGSAGWSASAESRAQVRLAVRDQLVVRRACPSARSSSASLVT